MPIVDINDPSSLEHAYPLAAFEHDAAQNARADAAELHGVRITSEVDPSGRFEIAPAKRSVAASSPDEDALFLAPYRSNEATSVAEAHPGYGGPQAVEAPRPASARRDYEAFLARVAEAARAARLPKPIGLHEDRLKGLRGG
jgi:hypothetical protein